MFISDEPAQHSALVCFLLKMLLCLYEKVGLPTCCDSGRLIWDNRKWDSPPSHIKTNRTDRKLLLLEIPIICNCSLVGHLNVCNKRNCTQKQHFYEDTRHKPSQLGKVGQASPATQKRVGHLEWRFSNTEKNLSPAFQACQQRLVFFPTLPTLDQPDHAEQKIV